MAGEIQIGGTTFATESGGTVTVSNVDSATNRTNLGLGSMATQNANAVALTGGSLTGTEIDLKSSGTTIYKSDGTTAVLSESGGVVTMGNATLASSVVGSIQGFELYELTSDITSNTAFGLTLRNSSPFGVKGDLIEESAGIISFNSTGIYLIQGTFTIYRPNASDDNVQVFIKITTDNTNYIEQHRSTETVNTGLGSVSLFTIINCTDTSNIKFKFEAGSISAGSQINSGNHSNVIVMKIG